MSGPVLRPLSRKQVRRVYRWELSAAFPPAERRPLWSILRMMDDGVYDALGCWRGDELLGYALLWRGADFVLLDYLGVCQGKRGQGTGTWMLEALSRRYAHTAGLLAEAEAEGPDAPPEVNALRARRLAFYRRCGFMDVGYEADIFGVRYAVLGRREDGSLDPAAAMAAHDALYRSRLSRRLYRRFIRIPADGKVTERRNET